MRQAHSVFGESHVAEFASSPDRPQNTLLRWLSRATCCLAACSLALLAACGGGRNDADLSHGRSSAMNSGTYGLPSKAPTSESAPPPEKWSSYFTEKASSDPYGLIGKEGARAKTAASGFIPGTAHRFYNTANGVHFYTLSERERLWVQANLPHFTYEGQGFFAVPTQVEELSPVYRFYNLRTGSHFYTINPSERDHVIATLTAVFKYEGIAWYGSTVPGPGWSPVYRFFNTVTGTHFYTATPVERENVLNTLPSFSYEGVGYYVRLTNSLDTTLAGTDENNNGVRDSVEQVLARLVVDPIARQANVQVAAAYERVLTEPLPSTREQAIDRISEMACLEESAGPAMYESNGGLASVVFDTDLRLQRLSSFLSALEGGFFGSELLSCANSRSASSGIRAKTGSSIRNLPVRVIFVNGMMNSRPSAEALSNELANVLGHDSTSSNFDYDLIYNPSAVSFGWTNPLELSINFFALLRDGNEIRRQAAISADARRRAGAEWDEITSNANSSLAYYRALGESYSNILSLSFTAPNHANSMVDTQIYQSTQRIANRVKELIDQGIRPVLVPHSQGNLFVEAALARLLHEIDQGLWPRMNAERLVNEVGVYGVAPVSATSWKNSYIRNSFDSAVGTHLPAATQGLGFAALPANTVPIVPSEYTPIGSGDTPAVTLRSLGADSRYHGFTEMYLNAVIQREQDRVSFREHVRRKILEQMIALPEAPIPQVYLPHTGVSESQCYQAGSSALVSCSSFGSIALSGAGKQDGMLSHINPMSYTKIGFSGEPLAESANLWCAIRDNVTGLMWENHQSTPGTYTNWSDNRAGDASRYALENSNLCGLRGWRLPTIDELETIINAGRWNPAISTTWFPNTPNGHYWSSTPMIGEPHIAWEVSFFGDGYIGENWRIANVYVRLVRSNL